MQSTVFQCMRPDLSSCGTCFRWMLSLWVTIEVCGRSCVDARMIFLLTGQSGPGTGFFGLFTHLLCLALWVHLPVQSTCSKGSHVGRAACALAGCTHTARAPVFLVLSTSCSLTPW